MKLYLVFTVFLVIANATVSDAVVGKDDKENKLEEAIKAKKEYDDEKGKPGLDKLKEAVADETKFGNILSWIRDAMVCLRRGTEAKNACYALSDFGLDMNQMVKNAFWFGKPYTHQLDKTNRWYEKLYNSIGKILLLEGDKEAPILLATKGGDSDGEEYNVDKIGIAKAKTFSKTSVKGEKVGENMKLNVEESFKDMPGTVQKVLKWIEETYDAESKKSEESS